MKAAAVFVSTWLLLLTIGLSGTAQAEESKYYAGVYGGYAFHQTMDNTQGIDPRGLDEAPMFGIKAGFIPPPEITWFNLEADIFWVNGIRATGIGGTLTNFDVRVVAFNWILRYPGERFQPYVGAGPGILTTGSFNFGGDKTTLGLNLVAGVRYTLTNRLSMFLEYKYNRTTIDWPNLKGAEYRLNAPVFGVMMNF